MKKKILLVSVSAGSGHVRAAEALRTSGLEKHPDWEIVHIDLMNYVPTAVKKLVVDTYDFMVERAPALYGFFYKKYYNENKSSTTFAGDNGFIATFLCLAWRIG